MSHPEQDGSLELVKHVEASYEQTLANFQDVSRLLSGGYGIAKKDRVYVTWRNYQKVRKLLVFCSRCEIIDLYSMPFSNSGISLTS